MSRKKRREKVTEFTEILREMTEYENFHKAVKWKYRRRQKGVYDIVHPKGKGIIDEENVGEMFKRSCRIIAAMVEVREAINTYVIAPNTLKYWNIVSLRESVYVTCAGIGLDKDVAKEVLLKLLEEVVRLAPAIKGILTHFCSEEGSNVKMAGFASLSDSHLTGEQMSGGAYVKSSKTSSQILLS